MSVRIYGNREIITLPGLEMRPTPAKVRQALFNIWQGEVNNCRWLDLCSGSGAMGAEAICRGASLVIGIESSRQAADIIRQNWAKVSNNSGGKWQLINGDARSSLTRLAGQTFDRIYCDPPYGDDLYIPILTEIDRLNLLAIDGEIAIEHSPYRRISQLPEPDTISFEVIRSKIYGKTSLTFYGKKEASSLPLQEVG
jgi:16S rRNA (guanine966-N2)-methyltransferase